MLVADIFTKKKRSWVMSRIRSKNTKIERVLGKELKKTRVKFRRHYKIPGSPDFVFLKKKVAVFVDGSFWHGHKWRVSGKVPKTAYWRNKIKKNMLRDARVNRALRASGWRVVRFWEHAVLKSPRSCVEKVAKILRSK